MVCRTEDEGSTPSITVILQFWLYQNANGEYYMMNIPIVEPCRYNIKLSYQKANLILVTIVITSHLWSKRELDSNLT